MCVFSWQLCAQGDSSIAIQEMKPAEVFPVKADTAWEDLNKTKKENEQLELLFTLRQKMGEIHGAWVNLRKRSSVPLLTSCKTHAGSKGQHW